MEEKLKVLKQMSCLMDDMNTLLRDLIDIEKEQVKILKKLESSQVYGAAV